MRYDADYGAEASEADPRVADRFRARLLAWPVDLMYAYVEGKRFVKGLVGFKIGRQYVTDSLGWWSFDGGLVRLTTPLFVAVEGYGGLEVRGGFSALARCRSMVTRRNLPRRSQRSRSRALAAIPTDRRRARVRRRRRIARRHVAALAAHVSPGLQYRRVQRLRVRKRADDPGAVQRHAHLARAARLRGEREPSEDRRRPSRHDVRLLRESLPHPLPSAEAYAGQKVTIGLDYDFYQPAFDGDSIFNFFASQPTHYMGLRGNFEINDKWSASASGFGRGFTQATSPQYEMGGSPGGPVPNPPPQLRDELLRRRVLPDEQRRLHGRWIGGGRYKTRTRISVCDRTCSFGDGGRRAGGDVFGERVWATHYVAADASACGSGKTILRPRSRSDELSDTCSGSANRFFNRSFAGVDFQHDINRLVGQRFRLIVQSHRWRPEMKSRSAFFLLLLAILASVGARGGRRSAEAGVGSRADANDQQVRPRFFRPARIRRIRGPRHGDLSVADAGDSLSTTSSTSSSNTGAATRAIRAGKRRRPFRTSSRHRAPCATRAT